MTISRSETIPTEAKTPCVKKVLSFSQNLGWTYSSRYWSRSSIWLLLPRHCCGKSHQCPFVFWSTTVFQSEISSTVQRKRAWPNIYVIKHRRGDKDVCESVQGQPGLDVGTVSRQVRREYWKGQTHTITMFWRVGSLANVPCIWACDSESGYKQG